MHIHRINPNNLPPALRDLLEQAFGFQPEGTEDEDGDITRMFGSPEPQVPQGGEGYNVLDVEPNVVEIEVCVPGLTTEDISVTTEGGFLLIRSNPGSLGVSAYMDRRKYIHQGFAPKPTLDLRFALNGGPDEVKVDGATLQNGILRVRIRREIPERLRPRTITVSTGE